MHFKSKFYYSLNLNTWLLHVYTIDDYRRLPQLLAVATSIYGSILKMDSTKVCKKLQGHAAGTATWVTNVGNERGEVLVSVLTDSEGLSSLSRMAQGLMGRYVWCPPNSFTLSSQVQRQKRS